MAGQGDLFGPAHLGLGLEDTRPNPVRIDPQEVREELTAILATARAARDVAPWDRRTQRLSPSRVSPDGAMVAGRGGGAALLRFPGRAGSDRTAARRLNSADAGLWARCASPRSAGDRLPHRQRLAAGDDHHVTHLRRREQPLRKRHRHADAAVGGVAPFDL